MNKKLKKMIWINNKIAKEKIIEIEKINNQKEENEKH